MWSMRGAHAVLRKKQLHSACKDLWYTKRYLRISVSVGGCVPKRVLIPRIQVPRKEKNNCPLCGTPCCMRSVTSLCLVVGACTLSVFEN